MDPGTRHLAAIAALLASAAAALAAVGSHLLARKLDAAGLASFNTAVAFQFVNALGLSRSPGGGSVCLPRASCG